MKKYALIAICLLGLNAFAADPETSPLNAPAPSLEPVPSTAPESAPAPASSLINNMPGIPCTSSQCQDCVAFLLKVDDDKVKSCDAMKSTLSEMQTCQDITIEKQKAIIGIACPTKK